MMKKGFAVFLSTAMLLTGTIPLVATAENETETTASLEYGSTLAADGTITTTIWAEHTANTERKIREFFYTSNGRICREYYTNQFSVSAQIADAENLEKQFGEQYTICTGEDGVYYFAAKDADTFYYQDEQFGDSKLSYDACKTLAAELMKSGCTDAVTIYQTYYDLDAQYYPVTGTIYVSGGNLSVDDFAWLDTDIQVSAEKDAIALVVPTESKDDATWTNIYDTMKSVLEKMPEGTSVRFQPYMYNMIITAREYNPCEVVRKAAANEKGDINQDNSVTIQDAFETLMYSSKQAAGASDVQFTKSSDVLEESCTYAAADIDRNGEITIHDAYLILMYASYQSVGNPMDWAELV